MRVNWLTAAILVFGIAGFTWLPVPFPGRYVLSSQGEMPVAIRLDTWTGKAWIVSTAHLLEKVASDSESASDLPSFWRKKWAAIESDPQWPTLDPLEQGEVKRSFLKKDIEPTAWFKSLPAAARKRYEAAFLGPSNAGLQGELENLSGWREIPWLQRAHRVMHVSGPVEMSAAGALGYVLGSLVDPVCWLIALMIALPARQLTKKTAISPVVLAGLVLGVVFGLMIAVQTALMPEDPLALALARALVWGALAAMVASVRYPVGEREPLGTRQGKNGRPAYLAELEHLAALRDKGVLSEEEFETKKQLLLGLSVQADQA